MMIIVARHRDAARGCREPQPLIGDAVRRWLPVRLVDVLHAAGIRTLADLTCAEGAQAPALVGRHLRGLRPAGRHIGSILCPTILRSPNALAR